MNKFIFVALLLACVCCKSNTDKQSHTTLLGAAAGVSAPPPSYQASWAQASWYIDPANSSTCASDANKTCSLATCGTAGDGPCVTYAQVAQRWGTYSPRLRQVTTLTFLSSQPDATDPVIWTPYRENGSTAIITTTLPTAQQTGTLASVIPKNRSTPQLLNATIGAGAASGMLIVNTTHSSYAWLYQNTSGNAWNITQPLAPLTPPFGWSSAGTEVDTWANGDAYAVYVPYNVVIALFKPVWEFGDSSAGMAGYIYNLISPTGISPYVNLNSYVCVVQSRLHSAVIVDGVTAQSFLAVNAYTTSNNGYYLSAPVSNEVGTIDTQASIRGGYTGVVIGVSTELKLDVILDGAFAFGTSSALMNNVYLGTGTVFSPIAATQVTGPVWGPGALNAEGTARVKYPSGGGGAVANFLLTGGLQINGATTACSHTGASPDVISCGITLSATNLDAAQGVSGFGGNSFVLGGGSISNGGL